MVKSLVGAVGKEALQELAEGEGRGERGEGVRGEGRKLPEQPRRRRSGGGSNPLALQLTGR